MLGEITSEEMRKVDKKAVEVGIPPSLLMERAGRAVTSVATEKFEGLLKVAIFAGTGNNGGDGFVTARRLVGLGIQVDLFLIGSPSDIRTSHARFNWEAIQNMGEGLEIHTIGSIADLPLARQRLENSGLIIDAMLGTGVKGELRDPIASIVRMINELKSPVIAVDSPTGLDPTTGEVQGEAVKADFTVTFHRAKTGFSKAREYTGELIVADIGIPREVETLAIGARPPVERSELKFPNVGERLVSACLLGVNCRYDGKNRLNQPVLSLTTSEILVPVCPEQLGGLSTPRDPMSIIGGAGAGVLDGRATVEDSSGRDVTSNLIRGAEKTMMFATSLGVAGAILKSKSPSCGNGVTGALLERNGIRVTTEDELSFG